MTLQDMLGAVRASVQAARAGSRADGKTSETMSIDSGSSETSAGSEVGTDVPDLGPLMFLGTDRRSREVAETVNLHWRAYAKQF
jgi:hypothetical protein